MAKELELLKKIRTFAKDHYPMQMHGLVVEIDEVLKEHEPQWCDNIPEHGRLCWVSKYLGSAKTVVTINHYNKYNHTQFRSTDGSWWFTAIPLTDDEIKQFLTGE